VLDNASYHNVKTEDTVCPNLSQKKAVLQNYFTQHNIPFSATDAKKVLNSSRQSNPACKTIKRLPLPEGILDPSFGSHI
jgi:hypothetical protein